jgi:hypothetical protein
MTIVINEDTVGLWQFDLIPGSNWLGGLNKRDGVYVLTHRLRLGNPNTNPWDSSDRKHWREYSMDGMTADQAIERVRTIVKEMAREMMMGLPVEIREALMDERGVPGMVERMKTWDCMHTREGQLQ